jgi:hypothetical protein
MFAGSVPAICYEPCWNGSANIIKLKTFLVDFKLFIITNKNYLNESYF